MPSQVLRRNEKTATSAMPIDRSTVVREDPTAVFQATTARKPMAAIRPSVPGSTNGPISDGNEAR